MIFSELGGNDINPPSVPVVQELEKDLRAELGSYIFFCDALTDVFPSRIVGVMLWSDSGNSIPTVNIVGSGRLNSSSPIIGYITGGKNDQITIFSEAFFL